MDTRAPHRGRPGSSSSAALLELPLQSPGSVFLLRRAFALALLFALELAALSIWLDDAALVDVDQPVYGAVGGGAKARL